MVIPSHSSHPPHRPTGACYQCENMCCLRILSLESSWLCRGTTKQFASENSGKQNGRSINLAWGVGLAGPDFFGFLLHSKRVDRQKANGMPLCQAGMPSFSSPSMVQTAKCHFWVQRWWWCKRQWVDDKGQECVVTRQKRSSVNCGISKWRLSDRHPSLEGVLILITIPTDRLTPSKLSFCYTFICPPVISLSDALNAFLNNSSSAISSFACFVRSKQRRSCLTVPWPH